MSSVDAVDSLGCRTFLNRAHLVANRHDSNAVLVDAAGASAIYLVGSGALGLALDAVSALLSGVVAVPIVRCATHDEVAFAPGSIVVAVSFAGDTPEVLDHVRRAIDRGVALLGLAASGPLLGLVREAGGATIELDASTPGPRWAFIETIAAVVGQLHPAAAPALSQGIDLFMVACATDWVEERAVEIARRIDRTMVVSLGAGAIGEVLAKRLAHQVEENAKTLALPLALPDLAYSAVSGFGQVGDVTRQVFTAVSFVQGNEAPADVARRGLLEEILDEQVAWREEVAVDGTTPYDQLCIGVAWADLIALALAAHVGIDPGPVPAIVEMKVAAAKATS